MKNHFLNFNEKTFLSFASLVIEKHIPTSHEKTDLKYLIKSIKKRLKDKRIYLAFIGEFSSGKSTFINGLLQHRLLKAACQATTASATFIEKGNEFKVHVTFTNDEVVFATEYDFKVLYDKLKTLYSFDSQNNINIFNLVDLLTSEESVANHVNKIEITYPSENLLDNLVIIDTPGISAGADYAASHYDVTKRIIENVADIAIVLIPSSRVLSRSLIDFLNNTLTHLLNRCIFILTAMDRVEHEERDLLIEFAKKQLNKKVGLDSPEVFTSSAITLLPILKIPDSKQGEWVGWQEKFSNLKFHLYERLKQQRSLIITEKLNFLIGQLIDEIEKSLDSKKEKLAKEEEILRKGSIQRIENIIDKLYDENKRKINKERDVLISKTNSMISSYVLSSIKKSNAIISNAGWDIQSYNDVIEPKICKIVEKQAKKYLININGDIGRLQRCCDDICGDFKNQFNQNYATFSTLDIQINIPSLIVDSIKSPSLNFASSKYYIERQNEEDKEGRNIGAVIGGILGTLILPGWGTAVGAAIGGGVGHSNGGDELVERQQKVQDFSNKEIRAFFKSYENEVKKKIKKTTDKVIKKLRSICDNHINQYSKQVIELICIHETEERRIKNNIESIDSDYSILRQFKEDLASNSKI